MTTPAQQRIPVQCRAAAWPTTIDTAAGEVRLRLGTTIDALVMRAGIAAEVNAYLVRHMFRAPIIVLPGSPADWVFLTGARTSMRLSSWEDLVRLNIGWHRRGTTIALPAPDATGGALRWLAPPSAAIPLPPWSAVVGAARWVCSA
ncbi:hypothetical protein [Allokutzneria albata]|uniref:Uncharacterized protein n=1 Tax=Allokutzneria albata TaxID=211114 RepID=A0A1G9SKK1_ALLAB|nr:hypothetical protein [Allokutzneria albata]SDM36016.1 hypothetical protein SAMN04489726_1241 [Allokutzneria albata]